MENNASFSVTASVSTPNETDSRLNMILAAQAELKASRTPDGELYAAAAAAAIKDPVTTEGAFRWFGLAIGTFGPMAIFTKLISSGSAEPLFIVLAALANITTAAAGFLSGEHIGRLVTEIRRMPLPATVVMTPLLGMVWGIISGGLGGAFFWLFGAIPAAVAGGIFGAAAISIFTPLFAFASYTGVIERNRLVPLIIGTVFTLCAFILG